MTEEQMAINRLMCGNTAHSKNADYIKLAIEALEKQVPKEPLDFGNESYLCPYCKRNNFYKGEYLDKQNYCDYCGQKIDWGD